MSKINKKSKKKNKVNKKKDPISTLLKLGLHVLDKSKKKSTYSK